MCEISKFNRFAELRDCHALIISFTEGETFCNCFSVCKKFYNECIKLKDKKSYISHKDDVVFWHNIIFPRVLGCVFVYDCMELLLNSLSISRSYRGDRLSDEWRSQSTSTNKYLTLKVDYINNRINKAYYYQSNSTKIGYEYNFVTKEINIIRDGVTNKHDILYKKSCVGGYQDEYYVDEFIKEYKNINSHCN